MNPNLVLSQSGALWNRSFLDLRSEETIAQILDRGSLSDWRALFSLCPSDPGLRARVLRVVTKVPLAYGHFFLAALSNLGEAVDLGRVLPRQI